MISLLFCLSALFASNLYQHETESLAVNDPRPVALAADMLEKKYGWIITYEDPPHVHESELVDVTEKVRRDLDKYKPGQAPKVFVPKGGELAFRYEIDSVTKKPADSAAVVQQLLDAYAVSGHPGIFRLDRDGERLHIIGGAYKDKDGVLRARQSVLDAKITMPAQVRNGLELIDAFCAAVSQASGTRMLTGNVPLNMLVRYKTESGAKDQRARDFLTHEFDLMNGKAKLSWRLLYDADSRTYYLNIHRVSP